MKQAGGPLENNPTFDPQTVDFVWDVHKYTNDYIRFADTKAAFTAGASTALIGSLVASSIFDSFIRNGMRHWSFLQWTSLIGLLLLSTAVVLSIAAIRPRLWADVPIGFIYWGSIVRHGSAHRFAKEVHALTDGDRFEAVSQHLFTLASIAKRKYDFVDRAIFCGVFGGMLAGFALFLQHALH